MRNNEKMEFLEKMIEEVREIPVEDVIGKELELHRKGAYYLALCPFHPDNHLGSFVITPSKNMWYCFACGVGGNSITFVKEYFQISFLEACFKLAIEYGIITQEEANNYANKKFDVSVIKHIERTVLRTEKEDLLYTAPADIIHGVYLSMAKICGLSNEHKRQLIEERKIDETALADFFTFPTRKMKLPEKVLEEIRKNLQERNLSKEVIEKNIKRVERELKYVPGFYINSEGKIDFVSFTGIGFLIRDNKGHIKGIQIRKDTVKPKESRYVWFSSAFAQRVEGCDGGAPSGAPSGYVPSINHRSVCITEGRFKAEALHRLGYDAIYLPGVSSWKNVFSMLDDLFKYESSKQEINLLFDADILANTAVYDNAVKLAFELLQREYKVSFVLWDKANGKGIDDLLNNLEDKRDIRKYLTKKSFSKFKEEYDANLEFVLKEFGVDTIRAIKKEDVDKFCEQLYTKNLSML